MAGDRIGQSQEEPQITMKRNPKNAPKKAGTAYSLLTEKERLLVDTYVSNGFVKWSAYRDSIARKGTKYNSLRSASARMFSNVNIQEAIAERLRELSLSRAEVLSMIESSASFSLANFIEYDDDGLPKIDLASQHAKANLHQLKKMKTRETIITKDDKADPGKRTVIKKIIVEIEIFDPMQAKKLLAQHHRLLTDVREHIFTKPPEVIDFT